MNYNNPQQKTAAPTTIVVCAVVFFLFSFLWFYQFQGDLLAVAQHVLSGGQTHYDRLIGAVLITVILFIVQQGVCAIVRLTRNTHALTYYPSFLLLAVLSSMGVDATGRLSMGVWAWLFPLLMVIWGGGVWLSKQLEPLETDGRMSTGLFSRRSWINVLLMSAMMLLAALLSNTNAVYHYRAHAEMALKDGLVDEALRVGSRSQETDESLTMLRLYALSRRGLVGDSLFSYAVAGTSNDMLPLNGSRARLLIYPADSLWGYLGSVSPTPAMTVRQYLDSLAVDTLAAPVCRDYRLIGMLIDCRLDSFVVALPRYYPVDADSLPRHYREALVLYNQTIVDSVRQPVEYHDTVMMNRWNEWVDLQEQYPQPREFRARLNDCLRNTYWNYFFYKNTLQP